MKWTKFLFAAVLAMFVGLSAQAVYGVSAYAVAGGLLTVGAILPMITKSAIQSGSLAVITVEIWQKHIEEEIFKDNSFLLKSHNASEYVLGGKVVHIPQSGGSGSVVKNRSSFPATVRNRVDTDIVYTLDAFSTDPVRIANVDTKELSYDKRNSVLGEDRDKLVQETAEAMLFNWVQSPVFGAYGATTLPAGAKLETTGATSVTATAPGATRNDLQRLQTYFRSQNKWHEGKMNILLPPSMLVEMYPADSIITATLMGNVSEAERRAGILMKDQGFNIMSRSSVLRTTAAGALRAPGETGATTDGEAALAWYEESVERAMGTIDAFEKLRDPQFYGDIYSFEVRLGGRARRSGYEGVAILRQGTPA